MKRILPIVLALILLCVFASCGNQGVEVYDVGIYYHEEDGVRVREDQDVFREDFLTATKVKSHWFDEEADPNTNQHMTILIKSQKTFDSVFANCPTTVDFDKEILVIYTETFLNGRPTQVKKHSLKDGVLSITLENKKAALGKKDTSSPYQRYVILKTASKDVENVEIEYIKN